MKWPLPFLDPPRPARSFGDREFHWLQRLQTIAPTRRDSILARCIDVPEFPPDLLYRGMPVVASSLVAEYEPDVTMTLTLDSRRDIPVCVQKGGTPMYQVAGRWLVHPKTRAAMVKAVQERKK